MYVTVGGAQLAQGEHRQEFLAGLVPAQDDIASPLAALALYGEREGVQVDHGHTVPAGCSLWPGTDMETFLVLRPKQMVVEPLTLEGGPHVEFLQAVPIYESERGFVREHGAEELLRRWEEAQVPFWSSTRPAAHPQGKDSG